MQSELSAYLQQRHASPATIELERRWLSFFSSFCEHRKLPWKECRLADLRAFHQELLWRTFGDGRLYATNTLDCILRATRGFYRWAYRTQLIPTDPTAAWRLPRTPAVAKKSLSKAQTLHVLNLPDLSQPIGQRDQVLLELLYYGRRSLRQCLALTVDETVEEAIQPHLRLYLDHGRRRLSRGDHELLLLGLTGRPIRTVVGLQSILGKYSLNDAPLITARLLHQSYVEHQEQLTQRRLLPLA